MKTDSLLYRLFKDWPGLVLELAGLDPAAAGYTLRAEEVKQTAFRLDGVLAPPDDQLDWPLVFIEAQFQPDADFHARWFSELFLYLYRRPPRRAWRAVALFPNRAAEGTVEAAYEVPLTLPWVKRVYLEEALRDPAPTRGIRVLGCSWPRRRRWWPRPKPCWRSRRRPGARPDRRWWIGWKPCWCTNCRACRGRRFGTC